MRHEEASRLTRLQLADTLKKRMTQKPLSKITVSELVADCGMNRKTFYYRAPLKTALLGFGRIFCPNNAF